MRPPTAVLLCPPFGRTTGSITKVCCDVRGIRLCTAAAAVEYCCAVMWYSTTDDVLCSLFGHDERLDLGNDLLLVVCVPCRARRRCAWRPVAWWEVTHVSAEACARMETAVLIRVCSTHNTRIYYEVLRTCGIHLYHICRVRKVRLILVVVWTVVKNWEGPRAYWRISLLATSSVRNWMIFI